MQITIQSNAKKQLKNLDFTVQKRIAKFIDNLEDTLSQFIDNLDPDDFDGDEQP